MTALQFPDRSPHVASRQVVSTGDVAAKKRFVAQSVDEARNTARIAVNPPHCPPLEHRSGVGAGHVQAMLDVTVRFVERKRPG